jgi:hypothetical protein
MSPLYEENVKFKSKSKDYLRNVSFHEKFVYDIQVKYRYNWNLLVLKIIVFSDMTTCKGKGEANPVTDRGGP